MTCVRCASLSSFSDQYIAKFHALFCNHTNTGRYLSHTTEKAREEEKKGKTRTHTQKKTMKR